MIFQSGKCISYGNWTVIPDHWRAVFDDMKNDGFDAIDLTFSESEERYAMRTIELQIELAHRSGLQVFIIPSRIGGRFAGAPLMPSLKLAEHPEWQLPGNPMIGCLENAPFRDWSRKFVTDIVKNFAVDGIIWDEPKSVTTISRHPDTLRQYGQNPSLQNMFASFLDYLADLTNAVKSLRPELAVTVFNMPATPAEFTAACPRIPGVDFCGFDGSCSRMSYFHEPPFQVKPTVHEMWPRTREECAGTSCGTFALIENILMPRSVHEEFARELDRTLEEVRADHLACYYWGHDNEDPNEAQRLTMERIRNSFRR